MGRMSELTADQAIKQLSMLTDDLRDREYAEPIATFIRTQSARVAELEKAIRPEFFEEQKALHARIAALESAARWKSCKDEPPEESGFYLMRWIRENGSHSHRVAHFLADKDCMNPNNKPFAWAVGTNRQPDEWRKIE